jgi:hypothetical protein
MGLGTSNISIMAQKPPRFDSNKGGLWRNGAAPASRSLQGHASAGGGWEQGTRGPHPDGFHRMSHHVAMKRITLIRFVNKGS